MQTAIETEGGGQGERHIPPSSSSIPPVARESSRKSGSSSNYTGDAHRRRAVDSDGPASETREANRPEEKNGDGGITSEAEIEQRGGTGKSLFLSFCVSLSLSCLAGDSGRVGVGLLSRWQPRQRACRLTVAGHRPCVAGAT